MSKDCITININKKLLSRIADFVFIILMIILIGLVIFAICQRIYYAGESKGYLEGYEDGKEYQLEIDRQRASMIAFENIYDNYYHAMSEKQGEKP